MALFARYPASPASIDGSATALFDKGQRLLSFSDDVASAHRPAVAATEGMLSAPLEGAPRGVQLRAAQTAQASIYAGAVVASFGGAVQNYDDGVDGLNAEWARAAGNDFGVAAVSVASDATPRELQQASTAHDSAVSAAREGLRAELVRRQGVLKDALDDEARTTRDRLGRGPNAADFKAILDSGWGHTLGVFKEGFKPVDTTVGLLFGAPGDVLKYWATRAGRDTLVRLSRYVPNATPPTWVRPHTRTLANGRTVNVRGYYRTGAWSRELQATAGRAAGWFKYGGMAVGAVLTGVSEWEKGKDLPTDHRIGRTATHTIVGAGAAYAGGEAGAWAGAAIGTAICPGVGTVIGGVVGAAIGAGLASGLVEHFGGDALDAAGDAIGDAGEAVADAAGDVGEAIGDAWDDVTPW